MMPRGSTIVYNCWLRNHLYQAGDLVWLSTKHIPLSHRTRREKFLPRFWGPFRFLELIRTSAARLEFPVQLHGMHDAASFCLLKPYRTWAGSADPAITTNGEFEFEVDQILDCHALKSRRNVPSQVELQVKWVNNAEDSWHLPSDLEHCQDVSLKLLEKLL
jgi:hypothetical protein